METLVELYVNEQFDDLAAALTFRPRRTVFLTTGQVPDRTAREGILRFLRGIDPEAQAEFINVGDRSIETLFRKIDEVFKKYPDCAVEMTGGSASVLIAAERYCGKRRVKSFYFDSRKGKFRNIYGMASEIARTRIPALDVGQLISMGGGVKTGCGHTTAPLSENAELIRGILDIYSRHLLDWNAFSEYLQFACRSYCDTRNQYFCAPSALLNRKNLLFANRRILNELVGIGALREYLTDGENISFYFENSYVREVLTTVGMCLELYIYTAAKDSGLFDSVEMSVVFDWDGVIKGDMNDTVNELDVVMTKGLSSVFVSCKTARPDTRDLYEITYLAGKFGGRNARAALATAYDLSGASWANYLRARDMGLTVIEMADIMQGRERVVDLLLSPEWLSERPE